MIERDNETNLVKTKMRTNPHTYLKMRCRKLSGELKAWNYINTEHYYILPSITATVDMFCSLVPSL